MEKGVAIIFLLCKNDRIIFEYLIAIANDFYFHFGKLKSF